MGRKTAYIGCVIAIIFAATSCKPKPQIKVTAAVEFQPELSDNSLVNVTYNWKVDPGFKPLQQDLSVYVHFVDKNNKILFQDDHIPADVPTSQWKEGYQIKYPRLLLVPAVVRTDTDEETMPLKVVMGLHDAVNPQGPSYRVLEQDVRLKYNPKGPEKVQYTEGWFDEEMNPQMTQRWRWTGGQAVAVVRNPKKNAILYIKGQVNKDAVPDQKVKFEIANNPIDEFSPTESGFSKYYQIPADQIGAEDQIQIRISVDKTFVPKNVIQGAADERELGVQIFTIFFK